MKTPALLPALAQRTAPLHLWQGCDQVCTWPASTFREAAALGVAQTDEGERLCQRLMNNIPSLRHELHAQGLTVMGQPSPIVPVLLGSETLVRRAAKLLLYHGVLANQAEFLAVPEWRARFRLQVMARHESEHARICATGVAAAVGVAQSAAGSVSMRYEFDD